MILPQSLYLGCKVILGCNAAGFLASAALETHKLTDLVGAGAFAAAASALLLKQQQQLQLHNDSLKGLKDIGVSLLKSNPRAFIASIAVVFWGTRLG